jgi:hypothetical protein
VKGDGASRGFARLDWAGVLGRLAWERREERREERLGLVARAGGQAAH